MRGVEDNNTIAHFSPNVVYLTSIFSFVTSAAVIVTPWVLADGVLDFIHSNRWGWVWVVCVMVFVPAMLLMAVLYTFNFFRYGGVAIRREGDFIVFFGPFVRRLRIEDLDKGVIVADDYLNFSTKKGGAVRVGLVALREDKVLVMERLSLMIGI
ncbi:hypothetical protein [Caulobacter sp. UNC279MFTsu5.1]|uniref:hypothetical protein n=1 Tax=Caulobacter sp. UNC279MFTsu5.1 TaxID=1502775 RepID=UPI00036C1A6D|nr:hypothetical protein [Caulobacter sp. UNC279MFTsu5.1]